MVLSSVRPARKKESKKKVVVVGDMAPNSTPFSGESSNRLLPSSTCPKNSPCITFLYDSGAFQIAASVLELGKTANLVSFSPLALET